MWKEISILFCCTTKLHFYTVILMGSASISRIWSQSSSSSNICFPHCKASQLAFMNRIQHVLGYLPDILEEFKLLTLRTANLKWLGTKSAYFDTSSVSFKVWAPMESYISLVIDLCTRVFGYLNCIFQPFLNHWFPMKRESMKI